MDTTLLPNTICSTPDSQLVVIDRERSDTGFYECHNMFDGKAVVLYRLFLTPMPQIPSRFKEHQFLQVAEHLGASLNAYPGCVRVDPTPLAVDTMARKLREAIKAKQLYSWKHPSIDEKLWGEHHAALTVSIDETTILVGSLSAIKTRDIVKQQAARVHTDGVELVDWTTNDIESLCLQLHKRMFKPTPVFLVRNLAPAYVESLEQRYDVAIFPLEHDQTMYQITA